jgi:hypothetical protein
MGKKQVGVSFADALFHYADPGEWCLAARLLVCSSISDAGLDSNSIQPNKTKLQ